MKPDTYKEYINAINQFRNKTTQISFNERVLVENSGSNDIIFTAKNYNIVGGLSQLIHTAEQNERYEVKALLGKGLNLQKDGVHVAFTGGTGILVFIDLIALIIRQNLGLLKSSQPIPIFAPGSTFKFVLYASFASREEAIGLELLEGLAEITKSLGLKNFHLELRFSNSGVATRWDREFIMRNIDIWNKEGLKKAYVCGPPVMNELFDRTIDSLINQ
jgi:NAD(P)H-flavin reductase